MNKQLRNFLMFGLGLVTVWDTFTTITGTTAIIGVGNIQIFISVIFGLIISAFLIFTIPILNNTDDDLIAIGAKILWFLAVCYDLYTSFTGNKTFIAEQAASGNIERILITAGMTIFVSSSPIGISYVWNKKY